LLASGVRLLEVGENQMDTTKPPSTSGGFVVS